MASPDSSPPNPPQSPRWAWLGAAVAATVFLLWFYRPFDWHEVATRVARARTGWVVGAVAANGLILVFWTLLWLQLLPATVRVGWSRMGEVTALTVAGMNTLPFMGGHALGLGLLAKRGGTGVEVAAAVLALDQLCEGLTKVLMLTLAMAVAPVPDWLRRAAWILSGAMLPLLAGLVWLSRRPAAPGALARWSGHFEILRHPRRWLGGLALNVATKLAEAGGIWAVQQAGGADLPVASVLVVLAAVNVATMVSVSPGNLGVYEAAAVAAYALFGVPMEQAVALALVQHACLLAALILPGYGLTAWRALGRTPAA